MYMEDMGKWIEGHQDPNRFVLKGRLQHEIAAEALRGTGVNPELAESIEVSLARHERIFGTDDLKGLVGLTTTYSGEAPEPARRDITFGLMIASQDESLPPEVREGADALIEAQQSSPNSHD
jgi:hypothetical protein